MAVFLGVSLATGVLAQNSCIDCHQELESNLSEAVDLLVQDVQNQGDFSCGSCCGGDSSTDEKEGAENRGEHR